MMSYSESAEGKVISRKRAVQEIVAHGHTVEDIVEFYRECGKKDEYSAQEVLRWLGY